jgi:hypothetical protein
VAHPNQHQKHQAGRHLAVAEALLHGFAAALQGAQTFVTVNGHTAAVQVAGKGAWMIANIENFCATTAPFYVLVDITGGERSFYIAPGDELRHDVWERHQQFMQQHDGVRPKNPDSRHTKIEPSEVTKWQDNWSAFATPAAA